VHTLFAAPQPVNGQIERCPSGGQDVAKQADGLREAGGQHEAAAAQVRPGGEEGRGSAYPEG